MKLTINKPTDFEAIYLKVDAGVRYWNDTKVNGVYDQRSTLRGYNWRWRPLIDIDLGKIVSWKQGVTANVHYKVCDDFQCDILDGNKEIITSCNGYVPDVMCPADEGYGDYIIMDIDEDGFIQNWNKELIRKLVKQEED